MLNMVIKGRVLDKQEIASSEHVCAMMLLEVTTFSLGAPATFTVEVWFPHFMKKRVAWYLTADVKYVLVVATSITAPQSKVEKFQPPVVAVLASDIDR